jgi:hypothetical protein
MSVASFDARFVQVEDESNYPELLREKPNGLSEQEEELIAMLAEEANEVGQMCMKILRHGFDSYHPKDPSTTNLQLLQDEVLDFDSVRYALEKIGRITTKIDPGKSRKETTIGRWKEKLRYTHHQQD